MSVTTTVAVIDCTVFLRRNKAHTAFDEFNLDISARYKGAPLIIPERKPTPREIIASEEGSAR